MCFIKHNIENYLVICINELKFVLELSKLSIFIEYFFNTNKMRKKTQYFGILF